MHYALSWSYIAEGIGWTEFLLVFFRNKNSRGADILAQVLLSERWIFMVCYAISHLFWFLKTMPRKQERIYKIIKRCLVICQLNKAIRFENILQQKFKNTYSSYRQRKQSIILLSSTPSLFVADEPERAGHTCPPLGSRSFDQDAFTWRGALHCYDRGAN